MTKKDDSRIDTIGRAIANPQRYSGELGGRVFSKFYDLFGEPGLIIASAAIALIAFYDAYRMIVVHGGIFGWVVGLFDILFALFFIVITFICAVFWRLDKGESTTIFGIDFKNSR